MNSAADGLEPTRVAILALADHVGERVEVRGWLHHRRRFGKMTFALIRDGTGIAQVKVVGEGNPLTNLGHESVVSVVGTVTRELRSASGVEIQDSSTSVYVAVDEPLPFELHAPTVVAGLDSRLDHGALTARHPERRATLSLLGGLAEGFRVALRSRGFVEVQTPKILATAGQGGAKCFELDYFGRSAYLAQSPQLYKQMLVGVFERVFEVAAVFRAEPHANRRFLSEYVEIDAELGFIDDHAEIMDLLVACLRDALTYAAASTGPALRSLGVNLPEVPARVPAIHRTEGRALLGGEGRGDFSPTEKVALAEWCKQTQGSEFLFIVGHSAEGSAFYAAMDKEHPGYTQSFDLLYRGVEIANGGQRLNKYSDYVTTFEERGIDPALFEGYLECFRTGMPPHGGFALGLEGLVAWFTGAQNIRDVTLFPRDPERLTP